MRWHFIPSFFFFLDLNLYLKTKVFAANSSSDPRSRKQLSACTRRRREKETDLQVQGVEFVVAHSQIGLQSLFGLVEVDTLSAPVLHLGSQLLSLHALFLQSALSAEQLENMAITTTPTLRRH